MGPTCPLRPGLPVRPRSPFKPLSPFGPGSPMSPGSPWNVYVHNNVVMKHLICLSWSCCKTLTEEKHHQLYYITCVIIQKFICKLVNACILIEYRDYSQLALLFPLVLCLHLFHPVQVYQEDPGNTHIEVLQKNKEKINHTVFPLGPLNPSLPGMPSIPSTPSLPLIPYTRTYMSLQCVTKHYLVM